MTALSPSAPRGSGQAFPIEVDIDIEETHRPWSDADDDEVTPVVVPHSGVRRIPLADPLPPSHSLRVGVDDSLHLYTGFEDYCARGVFVATYARFDVGTDVELRIDGFNGGQLFHTRVAWTREESDGCWPGVGLEVWPGDAPRLERVVSRVSINPPLFYPD